MTGFWPHQADRKGIIYGLSFCSGKQTRLEEGQLSDFVLTALRVAGCDQLEPLVRVAWLSLDAGDSDPARFLTYLIAALQTIAANIGAGMLGLLQSPQPPPTEAILTTLLNEIVSLPDNFVFVLDDYHVLDAKPVDASTSVDGGDRKRIQK